MLSQLPNYTTVLINCELNSVVAIGCRVMCAGRKTSRATFKEYGMSPQGACRKPNALYVRMNECTCTKFGKRFFVFCHYKLIIASFIKNFKKKKSQEKHWWYVNEHSLCCFTRVHDFSLHASQKLHGHGKIDRKAGRHTHKQTHRLNYRPRLINTYICCLFL